MSDSVVQLPQPFGPFVLIERLAEGGMGAAFLATAPETRELVVVKRLLPEWMGQEEVFQRFLHEAEVVSHVRHPNVAELIAMGTVEGEPFLAVEYVFGIPLSELVARVEAGQMSGIPMPIVLRIGIDLVAGLRGVHEAVHRQTGEPLQLIHRDIGGRNALLGSDGRVKIIDLGLGRSRLSNWQTGTHRVAGSPDYMAPEQAVGAKADVRSDVFAAAATVWELARGAKRIRASTVSARLERAALSGPEPLRSLRSDVPEEVDRALARAMENEAESRTASAAQLERDLKAAAAVCPPASLHLVAAWLDRTCATTLVHSRRRIRAATERLGPANTSARTGTAEYFFGSERLREGGVPQTSRLGARGNRVGPRAIWAAVGAFSGLSIAGFGWWLGSPPPPVVAPLPAEALPESGQTASPVPTSTGMAATTQPPDPLPQEPASRRRQEPRVQKSRRTPREVLARRQALARRLKRLRRMRYDRAFQVQLTRVGRAVSRARSKKRLDALEARIRDWERDLE